MYNNWNKQGISIKKQKLFFLKSHPSLRAHQVSSLAATCPSMYFLFTFPDHMIHLHSLSAHHSLYKFLMPPSLFLHLFMSTADHSLKGQNKGLGRSLKHTRNGSKMSEIHWSLSPLYFHYLWMYGKYGNAVSSQTLDGWTLASLHEQLQSMWKSLGVQYQLLLQRIKPLGTICIDILLIQNPKQCFWSEALPKWSFRNPVSFHLVTLPSPRASEFC